MTDAALCLRVAADCLSSARFCPSELNGAREYAAMAAAELPADLAAKIERALRCGDHRLLDQLAMGLEPPAALPTPAKPLRQRRAREPVLCSKRASAEEAAAILGLPLRTVQGLAAGGAIPGAAKLGRRWTFDVEKMRRFVKDKERQAWQRANAERHPDAIGGAILSGRGLRFVGANSDGRFIQVTRRLRGQNIKLGGND